MDIQLLLGNMRGYSATIGEFVDTQLVLSRFFYFIHIISSFLSFTFLRSQIDHLDLYFLLVYCIIFMLAKILYLIYKKNIHVIYLLVLFLILGSFSDANSRFQRPNGHSYV